MYFGCESLVITVRFFILLQKCSSTLRHKMDRSKILKEKYIADVPILLTPEQVTESEYKRLKQFRDLVGWKEFNFEGNNC